MALDTSIPLQGIGPLPLGLQDIYSMGRQREALLAQRAERQKSEEEKEFKTTLRGLMVDNTEYTPKGPQLNKPVFLQQLAQAGYGDRAFEFGRQFEEEDRNKEIERRALAKENIARQIEISRRQGDILTENMPMLRGIKDPRERGKMMFERYRAEGIRVPTGFDLDLTDEVLDKLAGSLRKNDEPSSVMEWRYYQSLPEDKRAEYLEMKRAQKTLDLGGSYVGLGPGGAISQTYTKTLSPGEQPATKGAQAAATAAGALEGAGKPKLTVAEEAIDKKVANEYAEFINAGGFADAEKGISQLDEVQNALAGEKNITGPVIGLAPDWLLDIANPRASDVKSLVEEVVQRNLRVVLGAQFTEREGKMLIARAYNSRLKPEQNLARVKRLAKQMKDAVDAKLQSYRYLEANGTMKGFDGSKLVRSQADFTFDDAKSVKEAPLDGSGKVWRRAKDGKEYEYDAATKKPTGRSR